MTSERRRSPRFPFFASAEITDLGTGIRLTARTSDLSEHGCYFDMMNPLPEGSLVKLLLTNHEQTFEAEGHIVHAQSNMGMGVAFDKMDAAHQRTLGEWLSKLQRS
jgi:c-di-GMP-binding flagellar brake protein YcgR